MPRLNALIRLLRPHQYLKNGFVLNGPFFSGAWHRTEFLLAAAVAFVGPKIAYLCDRVNSRVAHGDAGVYAAEVVALFNLPDMLQTLGHAAQLLDSGVYTLDNMVGRFVEGSERCLASPAISGTATSRCLR